MLLPFVAGGIMTDTSKSSTQLLNQNSMKQLARGPVYPQDLRDVVYTLTDVIDTQYSKGGGTAGTGVTAAETLGTVIHKTVLTLTNAVVTMVDEAGVIAYGSLKVYTAPEGGVVFLGGTADLALTLSAAGINADWDGDFGVGTAAAGNNATLATTEQNIIPSTATPQAADSATTAQGVSTAIAYADGTTTAAPVYLNILVDDADHDITSTPTNIIANGTITLLWASLGDYTAP